VTLIPDGTSYRCRFVPSKRQDLSVNLLYWFNIGLHLRNLLSWIYRLFSCCAFSKSSAEAEANKKRLRSECKFFLGHTRFATSSAPTILESHPHRFANPRMERVWRCDPQGHWNATTEKFEIFVTHNGDFDFWTLSGRLRTHSDMAAWLRTVLEVSNKTAACDSVKISGVMQYLRTQGMWFPSFRLAYQNVVQPPFEVYHSGMELLPNADLRKIAAVAEELFAEFVQTQTAPLQNAESIERFCTLLANKLVGLGGQLASQCGDCMRLATEATQSFLGNDLFTSLKFFLENAHGSFGLGVCSTIDPNCVALASRGQPMSLALDEEQGVVLWGSEASAQMVNLGKEENQPQQAQLETSGESRMESGGRPADRKERPLRCHWRHDLDESAGEVVELLVVSDETDRRRALKAGKEQGDNFEGHRFIPFQQQPNLLMRVFHGCNESFATQESFTKDASLVALVDNFHVEPLPPQLPGPKRVEADILSIPPVLSRIRQEWDDADSKVCRSAHALFEALQRKASAVSSNQCGRLEIDVLVMAVEASLWIGEQFAADLQGMFPRLRVVPLSANKICGVFSNHQGADAMTGFSFSSTTMALRNAVVIAISHSGQTFPTMHATHTLRKICGDKIFVVAGSIDSKMSAAVGQMAHETAPWIGRVIPTFAGWRPSEALTVSTVACHHTLTELLLYLGRKANESAPFKKMAGVVVSTKDIDDIARLNHNFVTLTTPETVGATLDGEKHPTPVSNNLRKQGRTWALHVLEGPHAWLLSAAYILGTVVSGYPPFFAIKKCVWGDGTEDVNGVTTITEHKYDWLKYVALTLDSIVYIFLPLLFSLLLRLLSRRQLFARLGKRTLVVGDVPYVNQLVESYVSKLFSLSYSIASIDVHGANPIDHLVHRFTHRVCRGVLLAVGRPDGRLFSQTKSESWVIMAMQQAKAIVHLLAPPEVVTVGHNPYHKSTVMDKTLTLSQTRPKFICETIPAMSDEEDTEPMKRMATFKHQMEQQKQAHTLKIDSVSGRDLLPIGSYLLEKSDNATVVNYSLLQQMSAASVDPSMHGLRGDVSESNHAARMGRTWSQRALDLSQRAADQSGHSMFRTQLVDGSLHRSSPWEPREKSQHSIRPVGSLSGSRDASAHAARFSPAGAGVNAQSLVQALEDASVAKKKGMRGWGSHGGLQDDSSIRLLDNVVGLTKDSNLDRSMAQTTHSLQEMLNHCTALETWYENRYASLERYMSFLVMFHAMADRVASFLPLHFDTSRSQSQLRVATTAAPISAVDIQHEWADSPTRVLEHLLNVPDHDNTNTATNNNAQPSNTIAGPVSPSADCSAPSKYAAGAPRTAGEDSADVSGAGFRSQTRAENNMMIAEEQAAAAGAEASAEAPALIMGAAAGPLASVVNTAEGTMTIQSELCVVTSNSSDGFAMST